MFLKAAAVAEHLIVAAHFFKIAAYFEPFEVKFLTAAAIYLSLIHI